MTAGTFQSARITSSLAHVAAWVILPLLTVLAATGKSIADDAKAQAYGRHLSQECTGCHRLDGVDNGIPSIIGWTPEAFVTTVKFYQEGKRTNPVMVSVATSLNDKQLNALADYFASLPKPAKARDGKKSKK